LKTAEVGRMFFTTITGFVGLATKNMHSKNDNVIPGDEIIILLGAMVPFVVRREQDCYRFIGEVHMYGIMDGEAVGELGEGRVEDITFR
jgi:hypothetical protein